MAEWLDGGCHCGAFRFRVRVERREHFVCNCSICHAKGMRGLIVESDAFEIVQGDEALETYRFNTGTAKHRFCRTCGIHPFSHPRSHPEGIDVNVRCLDDWQGEDDPRWKAIPFDGRNWEANVESIRESTARTREEAPMTEAKANIETSHLILHCGDTDATIDFWCTGLGGELEQDEEMASPALDAIFGREGVRIRDTFIRVGGVRIHTIETLDEKRTRAPLAPYEKPLGLSGLSFRVPDLDAAHARATSEGRNPTEIYAFSELDEPVRMFFLEDPDGLRVEMIEDGQ